MTQVEIYGFSQSTFVRTARMACVEKHVGHKLSPLAFRQESHRVLHPFLRMPAAMIDGELLFETLAIASYLDDHIAGPKLLPADGLGRARTLGWISAVSDYYYGAALRPLLSDDGPDDALVEAARTVIAVFDRQLAASHFLAGAEFSLADLFLLPPVAFGKNLPVAARLFDGFDNLTRWFDRMAERDSFAATAA